MDRLVIESVLHDRRIAYALTDDRLRVLTVNGAVDSLISDHERTGCSLIDLVPELVGCEEVLDDILSGKLARFQLAWVNREMPDGRDVYLTMVDLPYHDPAGRIRGLIHLVEDVSEMGQLQQQLAQHRNELRLLQDQLTRKNRDLSAANAELQRLDSLKSIFISVAAHELRSPLTSILGFVEVVLDEEPGALKDQQREYMEIVRDGTQRLLRIATDLLDATRIEAGRVELSLEPTDLLTLVESVTNEFRPQLLGKAQQLVLRTTTDLPAVLCDRTRAKQIVSNLLDNASKYTERGGSITVTLSPAEAEGFVRLSVADNGVGIAAQDQAQVFERFFRAESGLSTQADGAGIGLYITRSLVEMHGGRLWFESELGKGSTFFATFPTALS
jgi:signal transduction histidine kinase